MSKVLKRPQNFSFQAVPVRTTQNFARFARKKICQQEAIPSANDFFYLPKCFQLSPNFKDVVENIWRQNLSQEIKSFVF